VRRRRMRRRRKRRRRKGSDVGCLVQGNHPDTEREGRHKRQIIGIFEL